MKYVALLRGVNVGGRNKVPMAYLREALVELRHGNVRTYLQSGNAVFTTGRRDETALAVEISARIAQDLDLDIAVLVRSGDELTRVVADNPFPQASSEPKNLHVAFLSAPPAAPTFAAIDPARFVPDEFRLGRREIYIRYANGLANSALTYDMWQKALGVTATTRNWNTVSRLAALTRET